MQRLEFFVLIRSGILSKFSSRIQRFYDTSRRQDGVFFLTLVIMSIAVYWKFLFGIKAFVFVDIGDDSYYQTIPILMNRAYTFFSNFNLARYNILIGLGQFESSLNLTDSLITLFGARSVPYMAGLFQVLKTILAGWFFYSFTRVRGFDYSACILTALGFAFNGAMLTRLAFFSYSNEYMFVALALYALELLYQKKNKWLFPLASAMLVQSFDAIRAILYFLLFAIYTIFRGAVDHDRTEIKSVVRRVLQVAGLQLLGYGLMAALVLPGYLDLFFSNRLETMSNAALDGGGELVNANAILTSFLRSFSNEIIGNSATYTGRNTYVCGPAFVIGAMNVLVIPQIFVQTSRKRRIWYVLALAAMFAYIALVPLRLLMNGFAYDRFKLSSFWITIIMLYFSGVVWDRFFREGIFNRTLFLITGSAVLTVLLGLTLTKIRALDTTAAWITIGTVTASILAVILYRYRRNALHGALMVILIAVDLIVNSYTSVDHRLTLTVDEYKASYLSSGIGDLAASLKRDETDYFRICNFDSSYNELHCDGQANNYLSTSTYNGGSGVSTEYLRFSGLVGGNLINWSGYRTFANNDFSTMLNIRTLLGVKYVVYDQDTWESEPVVPYGYTLRAQGGYWVLQNECNLPLALAFDSVISAADIEGMDQIERRESLLANAMVENDSSLLASGLSVATKPERNIIAALDFGAIPLQQTQHSYTDDEENEILRVDARLSRAVTTDYAVVYANIDSSKGSNEGETFTVFWSDEQNEFSPERSMWYSMPPGKNQLLLELPIEGMQYLRIEMESNGKSVSFVTVSEVGDSYFSLYNDSIQTLRADEFSFTQLSNQFISGSIMLEQPKVLCFTLLKDPGWSASVNGKPAQIFLVDSAFMGVLLDAGENTVTLSYSVPYMDIFTGISVLSAMTYALLLAVSIFRNRKQLSKR